MSVIISSSGEQSGTSYPVVDPTRPVVSMAAEELYEILRPLAYADKQYNWPLLKMCEALANPLQEVNSYSGIENKTIIKVASNYVKNPSFEVNTTDWLTQHGTIIRDGAQARSGSYSGKFTCTVITNPYVFTQIEISGPTLGRTYTANVYIYGEASSIGDTVTLILRPGGGSGSTPDGSQTFALVAGWQRFTATRTLTQNDHTFIQVIVDPSTGFGVGDFLYIDSVQLVVTEDDPGYYVDGDSMNCEWEGAPHLSRTLRRVSIDVPETLAWSSIVDVDRVPYKAIPWLAQLVGVSTPVLATDETKTAHEIKIRELVRTTPGFRRGSPGAMVAAAQQFLTGTKTVILRERTGGNAYTMQVLTKTSETPNAVATEAAIRAQKPAAIVLTYTVLSGQDYQLLFTNHPNYQDVYTDYATYQGVYSDTPGL